MGKNIRVEVLENYDELEMLTLFHCTYMLIIVRIRHQKQKLLNISQMHERKIYLISKSLDI